jgi:hypothetical protein
LEPLVEFVPDDSQAQNDIARAAGVGISLARQMKSQIRFGHANESI